MITVEKIEKSVKNFVEKIKKSPGKKTLCYLCGVLWVVSAVTGVSAFIVGTKEVFGI